MLVKLTRKSYNILGKKQKSQETDAYYTSLPVPL